MKKTKIIATIGPSTNIEEKIIEMYNNGINVIRFNFSHADYENSEKIAKNISKLNLEGKTNLSMLLDTKGPEIRTGKLEKNLSLQTGNILKIYIDDDKKEEGSIYCDYPYILEDLQVEDNITIDSGLCNVKVIGKTPDYLETQVLNNCIIGSKRHINLPGIKIKLPALTKQDESDIIFATKNNFDFLALSFVRDKEAIQKRRQILKDNNSEHIKIISKIESEEAIENLEEIVEFSDGIMIARGDLGLEIPIEKLPYYQKRITEICIEKGKFFIIATHLLESMIENPFPTRAEVSDVYNSVLMNCDCIMLSGETATGKFPIETIKLMTKVVKEAEKDKKDLDIDYSNKGLNDRDIEKKVMIKYSFQIAKELGIKNIVILTRTGLLGHIASSFKSNINIYAITANINTLKYMNILYNIRPIFIKEWSENHFENIDFGVNFLKEKNIINNSEKVIVITDFQNDNKKNPIIKII